MLLALLCADNVEESRYILDARDQASTRVGVIHAAAALKFSSGGKSVCGEGDDGRQASATAWTRRSVVVT
jgi:hypothetical protein